MFTEISPREYAWQFSAEPKEEILWTVFEEQDSILHKNFPSRSLRRVSSSQYIRYDLVISDALCKEVFLDRCETKFYPDFIINIQVTPIATFRVAKKAACEIAACSIALPEDYRCWFWKQCGTWSHRILQRIKISGTVTERFGQSLVPLICYALQAELDMCEFLVRYCGEVMAQEFMRTAKRPWTVLAQLEVPPTIAFMLGTAARDVLNTRPDHVCRRLYQEDLRQIELDSKAIFPTLEPRTYPNDPDQYLVRVMLPEVSYEKGKETDVIESPTPIQPYHHPYDQRLWLSLGTTSPARMLKLESPGDESPESQCPSSRRSLRKQKIFYQSLFPKASKGGIMFTKESNFFGSFKDGILALELPSEAQVCQSQEWMPFFYAAVRLDRMGVQLKMQWTSPAGHRLHRYAKTLNRHFRDFVVLWGSTVYIDSIASARFWGGIKNQLQDLSRATNNKRIQRYSELTLAAEMDICEFILTTCSILEADLFLKHREDRPWDSFQNLTAQPDVSGAVERGAELALADRQHYYCYRLYTDCKHQVRSWRDPRWVVHGYFPHPGWTFWRGAYETIFRLSRAKPDVVSKQVNENEESHDQSSDETFCPD